jgi:flagellar FliJ protein
MAKFNFKLEGVLRQRKQIEQQRMRDLALTQQQSRQIEQELRVLNQSLQSTTAQMRTSHLVGRLDMNFLAGHRRYAAAMHRKGQALVQRLLILQRQAQTQQQALAEAAKSRKAIEKLKERRKEEWLSEQARREMIELDEISNQMFFVSGPVESDIAEGAA